MRYRAKIRSVGLTTRISPLVTRFFNTRNIADLRRLLAHNLDIQRGRQFIAVKFSTNRPVTTNYTVTRLSDSEVVQSGEVNPDGADETSFVIDGLEAGVRYELGMVADLSEQFDVSESFPAEFATLNLTKEIRTRLLRRRCDWRVLRSRSLDRRAPRSAFEHYSPSNRSCLTAW